MDQNTKDMAMRYMQSASQQLRRPEKFSFSLPDSQEKLCAMLLGNYGAVVESRDMDLQLDTNTESKVEKVVKWMYESRKRGLLLCGTLGNGKTTMLRALSRVLGPRGMYMEAQGVYDYFKANQKLPEIPAGCVLLLDDLGAEPQTYNDFGEIRYPLTEFLMNRYKINQPTILATNLTFDQIGERYGDRLQDRMREMFAQISYQEPSYRR